MVLWDSGMHPGVGSPGEGAVFSPLRSSDGEARLGADPVHLERIGTERAPRDDSLRDDENRAAYDLARACHRACADRGHGEYGIARTHANREQRSLYYFYRNHLVFVLYSFFES